MFTWLVLILMTITCTTALAQRAARSSVSGVPSYYPASYQQTGVIHDVGLDNTLVISGLKYQISSNTKIHTLNTQFATAWSLKTNEEVGFSFSTDASNKRSIDEIWLLPKGSVVLH
jgi:hypothetical protein